MNIVYIHQHFSTVRGKTGTRSYDFARLLAERGHRVTVVTGMYGPGDVRIEPGQGWVVRREIDGFSVRVVTVRYDNTQAFWRRILSFLTFMVIATVEVLRIREADVVFATSTPLTVGFPGLVARYLHRVPFVFEVRDIWPDTAVEIGALTNPFMIWMARIFERACYYAASRVVTISERMAYHVRRRLSAGAAKVVVIPLGTDVGLFDRAEPARAWQGAHGLEGKFVAVFAGAHGRLNALRWVLEAARRLKDEPSIRFVLIGEGALKPELRAQAQRDGLENVLFLDPITKVRLAGVLKVCGLGLMTLENLPVFDTACPNKFMDYLAAGLPVLVNFDGEAGWIAEREGCGVVVPPDDPAAMAEAIRELASDSERCRAMGRRACALASRCYDRRRLIAELEAVFREAVALGL